MAIRQDLGTVHAHGRGGNGAYIVVALLWLRWVEGVTLQMTDWLGAGIALIGMAVIVSGWKVLA